MLYPFMTLDDETEIVHSEPIYDEHSEKVKVCIEKPVYGGFNSATCWLPTYKWEDINGFSNDEIIRYQSIIGSLSHIIIELARNGGFNCAENV